MSVTLHIALYVVSVACGSYIRENEGPFALVSEGCALRVILEDYNHNGCASRVGYLYPGSVIGNKEDCEQPSRIPCFSLGKDEKQVSYGNFYSKRDIFGCYLREGSTDDVVFYEERNSLVTFDGEMFPHGMLKRIQNLIKMLQGKRIPCIGAPRGCEKPDLVIQPQWDMVQGFDFAKGNFTYVYDWEKRKNSGYIMKHRRGFSEGWCTPNWENYHMENTEDLHLLKSLSLKCPCKSQYALGGFDSFRDFPDLNDSDTDNSLSFTESFMTEPYGNSRLEQIYYDWRDYVADDSSLPGRLASWINRTLNLPVVQNFLQTSGVIARQLSRFLIDLLYTVILLVVVLRSVIWWVETM